MIRASKAFRVAFAFADHVTTVVTTVATGIHEAADLLPTTPFERLTAKDIAEAAGVGYATFFRHYADKEALLADLAQLEIRKVLTMALPLLCTVEARPSSQALCAYVWENRAIWSVLLNGGAAGMMKAEFMQ